MAWSYWPRNHSLPHPGWGREVATHYLKLEEH